MKTRCPECQTTFRVTPEQLKARAGKVRCGQCSHVFNALDYLLDEEPAARPVAPVATITQPAPPADVFPAPEEHSYPAPEPAADFPDIELSEPPEKTEPTMSFAPVDEEVAFASPAVSAKEESHPGDETGNGTGDEIEPETQREGDNQETPLSATELEELGKANGLIVPRDTTEIPGYSKWSEGVMPPPAGLAAEKVVRWPFTLATVLLVLALAGQLAFHFRTEIALSAPALRPALAGFSRLFGADIPLPRDAQQVSIETSDLQTDPAHGNRLLLTATLRNSAKHEMAYPVLELALTDTADEPIARRVFAPADYLPAKLAPTKAFPANTDIAIRLWIEAREVEASGYRLYVFYP
ncbi:DUF3426 domain-containing protein [Propionivibrio limicola]|uniref:DUF3426 domain-containing protein n=1 Tax=Propionivibrio limicola TaxID=167645 RepID=UPI0012921C44|nr:DUF3426 domain-containing protein [Propionivibrio limicola]